MDRKRHISSQERRNLRGRRGGARIAAEHAESASQNSFLIPTSQKVAERRVLRRAKIKNFDEKSAAEKARRGLYRRDWPGNAAHRCFVWVKCTTGGFRGLEDPRIT